jgi:hypothetical protein
MLHVTLICAQLITTPGWSLGLNFVVESLVKMMQSIFI